MYDYVIVTHIPAFYKVNLYNELAKKLKILVIFISENTNEKRSEDFVTLNNSNFEFLVLSPGSFQDRSVFQNLKKIKKILKDIKYKRILVGGWDLIEFWYVVLFYTKQKNCLALESTVLESNTKGLKGLIKKVFLFRIDSAFASGKLHVELLNELNFKGNVKITKGVGLINTPSYTPVVKKFENKFIYIGRLSKVKNIDFIIRAFNNFPDKFLTIVGEGEEIDYLKSISSSNIIFSPPVKNSDIKNVLAKHDVFLLPSLSEPWGLVVEEALYFGLPVIVSKNCGSSELIKNNFNGYVFEHKNAQALKEIIEGINDTSYNYLCENISVDNNKNNLYEKVSPYLTSLKMS